MRASGILLPVSSIPSDYGIGCFSKEAYIFADQLERAGQKYWQILPLGPTGYGDSPYQAFSTFAGNPYFIDLEELIKEGLLTKNECCSCDWGGSQSYVDYGKVYMSRFPLLRKAYSRWNPSKDPDFAEFTKENSFWLEDYCLFTAIKNDQGGMCWSDWSEELRDRKSTAVKEAAARLKDEVVFWEFLQYKFFTQWTKLKAYVNKKGIKIIGDVPIYVAADSADAWANPLQFQFDEEHKPKAVAGCPPDAFSATGQLWGNPLYDWKYHKKTGYEWWIQRMKHSMKLYDVVRIDHFRGFDEYYSIPYGHKTAELGKWEKGPGIQLFDALREALGELDVIAEDLGYLTDSVRELLKESGFPGMKILQFAYDGGENSAYLTYKYDKNCVVYTGTHDNETTRGWYHSLNDHDRWFAKSYMGCLNQSEEDCVWAMIRTAFSSVADLALIPIQDYLFLGNEARMNAPATFGDNWKWRLTKGQISDHLLGRIRELTRLYGR